MVLFVAELHSFVCLLNYMSIAFDKYLLWILNNEEVLCSGPSVSNDLLCSIF